MAKPYTERSKKLEDRYRNYFIGIAHQCIMIRESLRLGPDAAQFIDEYVAGADENSGAASLKLGWVYLIAARHATEGEKTRLLNLIPEKASDGKYRHLLSRYEAVTTMSDDLWWYKHALFPTGPQARNTYLAIYATGIDNMTQ